MDFITGICNRQGSSHPTDTPSDDHCRRLWLSPEFVDWPSPKYSIHTDAYQFAGFAGGARGIIDMHP